MQKFRNFLCDRKRVLKEVKQVQKTPLIYLKTLISISQLIIPTSMSKLYADTQLLGVKNIGWFMASTPNKSCFYVKFKYY